MISLAEARAHVRARIEPLPVVEVPVDEAVGLVTAEEVRADQPVPSFDNTAMDGFAVRSADVAGADDERPVTLAVIGTVAAGAGALPTVGPGQAARIMTGAPVPPGADAVVMVERTDPVGGSRVAVQVAVDPGNHIRRVGEDLSPGDAVVGVGTVVTASHVGLLHTVGVPSVEARRPPRVGVLSTGDELVTGLAPVGPGQIRDSNRPTLLALVAAHGFIPVDLGRILDDESDLEAAITSGAVACDALLTTGGVSMGDFDLVKVVLDRVGDMAWMQVAIRPAKPLAFGVVGGTPVFGLPGNPVSALVSYELFARPSLRQMMGHPGPDRPGVAGIAVEPLRRRSDGKTHFARVRAEIGVGGILEVRSAGGQGSHQMSAMAAANALAVLEDGNGVDAGAEVTLIVLDALPGRSPFP